MISFRSAILTFFLLLASTPAIWAQIKLSDRLNWKPPIKEASSVKPAFEGASYDLEPGALPKYCKTLDQNLAGAESFDLSFSSISYVAATREEAAAIKRMDLQSVPQLEYNIGQFRNQKMLSICFFPFVQRQGEVQKVQSFDIKVVPKRVTGKAQSFPGASRKSAQVTSSVLDADGWYKLSVNSTGLYKITPAFLSSNNISAGSVAVNDLRIVGNGTGMLPEIVGEARPDDLLDVPLKVFDNNNDGLFNGSDYAVFYAQGPHQWKYANGNFSHILNSYRNSNYYFVSVTNGPGEQVPMAPQVTAPATTTVTSFDDYEFEEKEENNLVGTGREWFGNLFDFDLQYNSKTFSFPNLVQGVPVRLKIRAVSRASTSNTTLVASVNGVQVTSLQFPAYSTMDGADYVTIREQTTDFISSTDNFVVQFEYQNSANPAGVAWLDYIQVQARRDLQYTGKPLLFRDIQSVAPGAVAEFKITNAIQGLQVWDVTDHNDVHEMDLSFNNGEAIFKNTADKLREYVAFTGSGMPEPGFIGTVARQNLHALPAAEMLIVAHPKFLTAAQRLADFHVNNDGISTHVVTTDEVYNEFSSGGQDLTAIRDFARLNYEKSMSATEDFNYLLLFGDASYDYKDRLSNNSNFVPVFEGGSSLSLKASYITDDYYAYLNTGEGGNFKSDVMDIGVGRIPSGNLSEANSYVDKVIHYTNSSKRFGDWRNRVLLMTDDVDLYWEDMFVEDSEILENIINQESKAFNVDKIYTDAYDQVSTTGSETYPEASKDMFRKVQQGNLVTNYIGHGGEIGLSSEKLLKLSDVKSWNNIDAMPFFITITCEFTRLDDPKRTSAGEILSLNPNGGAIGLISTTRVVNATSATELNKSIFRVMFERPGNEAKTFGEIIRDAKNNESGSFERLKFSLIGDPAVKLAIPYYNVQTTSINGKDLITSLADTISALSKVTVSGQVNNFNDQKIESFNGVADVSVFDKANLKETLVNDGVGSPIKFNLRNNLIYRGKAEVSKGEFQFSFIVPKDISYKYGYGKISVYAHNENTDAAGYMDTVVVGGINNDAPEDNEGPVVQLYMNDESFVRGGVTDESPELYAIIADSSGVNTVGTGIGHDLVAVLDNETDQSYVLNEYYEADINSYQEGKVRYPFYDLEEGQHSLKLRVFDVHNNWTDVETEFIVAESADLALQRVLNYPNPFTTYTEFHFEHNRANQPLEVQVQIFTVSGKLVKTINQMVVSEGNRVTGLTWNGLDDYGDKIGKGVYVYRLKVRSQLDDSTADQYEKLVILR